MNSSAGDSTPPFRFYCQSVGVKGGALASPELSGTEPVKDREKGGRSGRRRRAPGPRQGEIVLVNGMGDPAPFRKGAI